MFEKLEAVIRPERFQLLRDELAVIGIDGLTVTEGAGIGKQEGKQGVYRGTSFEVLLTERLKLEMVVEDEKVDKIVEVILRTCKTGQIGDGKIFILPIEEVIRIRTVTKEEEITGLDFSEHGTNAYELKEALLSSTIHSSESASPLSSGLAFRINQMQPNPSEEKLN